MRKLYRDDGENLAVRAFLVAYGSADMAQTIGRMADHMKLSGYPYWPKFVEFSHYSEHLTKAAAQDWLRHLFALKDDDGL